MRSSTQLTLGLRRGRVPREGLTSLPAELPGGPARLAGLKDLCGRGWPSQPSVKMLTIPAPPVLPAGATAEELRAVLAKTYRETIRQVWGSVARFGTTRGASKHDAMLDEAAARLRLERVAPARWALFSAAQWLGLGEATDRPLGPVAAKWVFSRKRLDEQLGRAVEVELFGVQPTNRALAELWQDWGAFARSVIWAAPRTRDEVLAVIDQYFPEDRYERMVDRAEQERARLQRWVDSTVAEGGIVWAL